MVYKTGCDARGEYARDEDGGGFREIPAPTRRQGVRSLLRS